MSEAPKKIYLVEVAGLLDRDWMVIQYQDSDLDSLPKELKIEYIRADLVTDLKECLQNALRCGWHSMEGSLDGNFDDLSRDEISEFRAKAKQLLGEVK